MKIRQLSKVNWHVEITDEDKKKLAYITGELKPKIELPPYGKWKNMTSEEVWKEILIQFCVRGVQDQSKNCKLTRKDTTSFLKN